MATNNTATLKRPANRRFAGSRGSVAASEPLMPYEQWKALGAEKAAEYLAKRRGYDAKRQGKLWAVLDVCWNEKPQNGKVSDAAH